LDSAHRVERTTINEEQLGAEPQFFSTLLGIHLPCFADEGMLFTMNEDGTVTGSDGGRADPRRLRQRINGLLRGL
jgi:hypothetical protein